MMLLLFFLGFFLYHWHGIHWNSILFWPIKCTICSPHNNLNEFQQFVLQLITCLLQQKFMSDGDLMVFKVNSI